MSRSSSMLFAALLGALVVIVSPALAQAPTEAQQKALRANCPSDFREHCSGVPTGGMDALVCLEKNVNSLSPGCKAAVEAVETPPSTAAASGDATKTETSATPPATSAPPTTTAPSSAPPTASTPASPPAAHEPQLTLRQEMALAAGACAVDFRLLCPKLPVGHGNILFCLSVHGPRLAPACHDALVKAGVSLR
jgi:hypothetical protein